MVITRRVGAHNERSPYPRSPFVEDEHRDKPHGESREEDRERGASLQALSVRHGISHKRTEQYVEEQASRRRISEYETAERNRWGRNHGSECGRSRP